MYPKKKKNLKKERKEAGENKQSEKQYKNQSCILKTNKFDFLRVLWFSYNSSWLLLTGPFMFMNILDKYGLL